MTISIKKYVDIVSGVGGAAAVAARELIGRLFSTNVLIPTNSQIEFTTLEDVAAYFGTSSSEYKRAAFYFGFISKSTSKARKISFARWTNVDVAPRIFGDEASLSVAEFEAITDGTFELTMGAETHEVTVNFDTDASFADVASSIQSAIQAFGAAAVWTGATVTYNVGTKGFDLVGGAVGEAPISCVAGTTGTNIFASMGWALGVFSDGDDAEEPVAALIASDQSSDNFGSFLFMPILTISQVEALAVYNNTLNIKYLYPVPVQEADTTAYNAALADYSGTGLILINVAFVDEYPEMCPMIVLAATDYTKRNSVQNYMFQIFAGLSATVTDTPTSNALDALKVNYYGQTAQAGQNISFFQRGLLMGTITSPIAMNVYANEIWLKDAALVTMLNMLLSSARVPANQAGENQATAKLQEDVIDKALFNGVISVGKPLSSDQKAFITNATGDDLAWQQVQSSGYWMEVVAEQIPSSNPAEYQLTYTIIYAKDDAINKVSGTHSLI